MPKKTFDTADAGDNLANSIQIRSVTSQHVFLHCELLARVEEFIFHRNTALKFRERSKARVLHPCLYVVTAFDPTNRGILFWIQQARELVFHEFFQYRNVSWCFRTTTLNVRA